MIAVKSISHGLSPLDSLVGKRVTENGKVQSNSKFHSIEDGVHFLVLAKAREISFDDDTPPSDLPDVFLDVEKISFEDAQEIFAGAPATHAAFIRSISELPLLELGRAAEAPASSNRSFQTGKLTAFFSHEIQQGISGKRGSDHEIPIELLKKCIRRKQDALYRGQDTEFYFFDDETKRVLKMVVRYPTDETLQERKQVTILTAFYPQYSYLRHQFRNYSDVLFQSWIEGLPKVRR